MNRTWGPTSGQANTGGWVRKVPEYQDGPPQTYAALDGDSHDVSRQPFDIADLENRSRDKEKVAKEKSTKF